MTARPGDATVQYNDAFITASEARHYHNLNGNFGLLPWLEAGGRIVWDNAHSNMYIDTDLGPRDLSANLKLVVPFIPEDWVQVAVGEQDVGGAANFFDARYVVMSRQFRYARIDVGHGVTETPGRFLDGSFGAVELQPTDWLGVIGEHDGQAINAGFRVGVPASWQFDAFYPELKVLAWSDRDTGNNERFFGLSLTVPLGEAAHRPSATRAAPMPPASAQPVRGETASLPAADAAPAPVEETPTPSQPQAFYDRLARQLVADKFEHVLVGEARGDLVVAFGNNQFNHNELDAIGWVLARSCRHAASSHARVTVILRNEKLPVLSVTVDTDGYLRFIDDVPGTRPLYLDAQFAEPGVLGRTPWYAGGSYGFDQKPRVMVAPSLRYAVATEYGIWDYSLAAQTDAVVSLWPGALVSATYMDPIAHSDDFDTGMVYGPDRQVHVMDEYQMQQTFLLAPGLFTSFHGGRYMRDYDGYYNQTAWLSPEGLHKFSFRHGDFVHQDFPTLKRDVRLLGYRYFFADHDVWMEATGGEFWQGDTGYRLDTRFWFGDSMITLEFMDTDATFVGMRWSVPLTPRRDVMSRYGQLKGRESWGLNLQTRIREDANYVSFGNAIIPRSRQEIERIYLSIDRLSPAYVRQHWPRLRDVTRLMTPEASDATLDAVSDDLVTPTAPPPLKPRCDQCRRRF